MAVTIVGFDGTVSEAGWAQYHEAALYGKAPQVVMSGCNVSPAAGTRALSVSTGVVSVPGVRVDVTAAETVTLAANTGTTNRTDWVVLRVDWSANTATMQVLQGVGTSPTFTKTSGSLWQVPLASVTVRPGVSVIATSDITARKPTKETGVTKYKTTVASREVFATSTGAVALSVGMPDPGWPYVITVSGYLRLNPSAGTTGYAALSARMAGVEFAASASTANFATGNVSIPIIGESDQRSAPGTFELILSPLSVPAGGSFTVGSNYSNLVVRQVPA